MRPLAWLITPIAAPAWLLEAAYRRGRGRFWEFGVWSGTVYFVLLVAVAVPLVLDSVTVLRGLGFYILTALEAIGLVCAVVLPVGDLGGYRAAVVQLARRKVAGSAYWNAGTSVVKPVWIALSAYLFSVGYFAVCSQLLYELDRASFSGVTASGQREAILNFLYATFVSMVTLGYAPGIEPTTAWSKALYMMQFGLGLAFLVLIFSAVVDQLAARRERMPDGLG